MHIKKPNKKYLCLKSSYNCVRNISLYTFEASVKEGEKQLKIKLHDTSTVIKKINWKGWVLLKKALKTFHSFLRCLLLEFQLHISHVCNTLVSDVINFPLCFGLVKLESLYTWGSWLGDPDHSIQFSRKYYSLISDLHINGRKEKTSFMFNIKSVILPKKKPKYGQVLDD